MEWDRVYDEMTKAYRKQGREDRKAQERKRKKEDGIDVDAEAKKVRQEAARKGQETRRNRKILGATPFGRFLLALEKAQDASEQAKSRAANAKRMSDYHDSSEYRWSNYGRSRRAREKDYQEKAQAVASACKLAGDVGVPFGWQKGENQLVPWIVYFDLTGVGQVSFHATERGEGPDYVGKWDGVADVARDRINAAIREHVAKTDATGNEPKGRGAGQ